MPHTERGTVLMKRMLALLLTLAALVCCFGAAAEEPAEDADFDGVFVLMTIPYELFYEAETTAGHYDSVSSATRVKPLMMVYAGGSFHYMPDGREITGVIFPVYAEREEMLAMYGGEEITDDSSVDVIVNDKGEQTITTFKGKAALFQSYPFSYYRLSEAPAVFKRLGWDSSFGPMEGLVVMLDGTVSLISDPFAQVCLSVEGVEEVLNGVEVNAMVLVANDGTRLGMKHIENIWLKTFSGFNFDSELYSLLKGRSVVSVEFYTFDAKYVVTAEEEVAIE